MRFLASILALLILALSCMPCADIDAMSTNQTAVVHEVTHGGDQNSEHKDLCSPFCHCSCCTSFSIVNVPVRLPEHIIILESRNYTDYVSVRVTEIALPVWQPPQLG